MSIDDFIIILNLKYVYFDTNVHSIIFFIKISENRWNITPVHIIIFQFKSFQIHPTLILLKKDFY